MSATTVRRFTITSVRDAVRAHAADCTAPSLVVVTARARAVAARSATWPADATADAIVEMLAEMATLLTCNPIMIDPAVVAFGVALPGERVAFAADRHGRNYHIQLPGAPTVPLQSERWGDICDGLIALINAI